MPLFNALTRGWRPVNITTSHSVWDQCDECWPTVNTEQGSLGWQWWHRIAYGGPGWPSCLCGLVGGLLCLKRYLPVIWHAWCVHVRAVINPLHFFSFSLPSGCMLYIVPYNVNSDNVLNVMTNVWQKLTCSWTVVEVQWTSSAQYWVQLLNPVLLQSPLAMQGCIWRLCVCLKLTQQLSSVAWFQLSVLLQCWGPRNH